jgi:hypothetical protein
VERLGGSWNGATHRALVSAHSAWFDVAGDTVFTAEVEQSIDDFIEAQHSRATWARRRMRGLAAAFDKDIRAALEPCATSGRVRFQVKSRLTWGRPRLTPRSLAD